MRIDIKKCLEDYKNKIIDSEELYDKILALDKISKNDKKQVLRFLERYCANEYFTTNLFYKLNEL